MRKLLTGLCLLTALFSQSQIVINEVYGGGGNSGATYKNDFIELYNNSSSPVNLAGWSIQYASATGSAWQKTDLSGTIPANGYYLIQQAQGSGGTVDLPTPDAIGTIAMSATAGKVALVNNTTLLSGTCPSGASIIDFVGFGTTANCFEGSGPTPAPSNINSVQRTPEGSDANSNNSDFTAGLPSPKNSSTIVGGTVSIAGGNNAAEPSTNGTFNITLSSPAPPGGITVNYTLGGTAILNTDYTDPQAGSITVAEGNSSAILTMNVIDDPVAEPVKTISVTINSVTAPFTIGTASASINITSDDFGPIALTGIYTQDFNTLANTGTANTLSIQGWLINETGGGARDNELYAADNGTSNTGDTYSYGSTSSTERALGSLQSGTLISAFGSAYVNNTGTTITKLRVTYTGEQWRLGATGRNDRLDFQYSTNATDLVTGTWTDVNQLDFTGIHSTGTVGALDGNNPANRITISFDIPGLSIPNGAGFMIRWNDFNATGADDGLAIDDFSIEPNPLDVTPPSIASLSPANGASNIPLNYIASIIFDEPVQKSSGNILIKRTADNSTFKTIDVSSSAVSVSSATASFSISVLEPNTGYYIEIDNGAFEDLSGNDFGGISSSSTWAFTSGTDFYIADFNTCTSSLTDGFTQFSVTGAIVWGCTAFGRDPSAPSGTAPFPSAVQINGFSGGTNVPNTDWLISPSFDLTGTTYPLLSFWSRTAFNGQPLQLKVSTNYTGGDPTLATWTDINGKFPQQASNIWTLSENINLSAFKQSNVHFAFVYTSTDDDGARWTVDDVSIINSPTPPPPSLTASTTDIQFSYVPNGSTADRTFTFTGNDLISDVTLVSTGVFLLSKDGSAFSSSLAYTIAEANNITQTVYVRFAPDQNNQDYTGAATITTGSLSETVNLKGTSIDPATTLEVVNWNVEWFGSPSQGPANDNQQEQHVKTILQNIGADIYGLVEIVDEARLAGVVNQMPGYSYVISNYGSHTNTAANPPGALASAQKLAFVYKTEIFSNVAAEPLLSAGINSAADLTNPAYNYWASGRFPYMLSADVTLNCVTRYMRFILIHAKANTSPTAVSYDRRKKGADSLHFTLNQLYPNDNIIILGDFNDDLDQSITAGFTTTSWNSFTDDMTNYEAITLPLSLAGKKSTVSFNDVIDHVVVSNEVTDFYMNSTANILNDVSSLVSNYGSTTSDHFPVFSRYAFRNTSAPVITASTSEVAFCATGNNTYTIPAFAAVDDCNDALTYSYTIAGATERNGSSNNASGSFNEGTSIITWTATDSWGNSVQCQTTVVINPVPTVTIPDASALPSGTVPNTVYIGYTPASSITLNAEATGGTASYTYNWSNGSANTSVTVSPVTNTIYGVTVTDMNGCQASAEKEINVMDIRAGKTLNKVKICHKQGSYQQTLEVSPNSVQAHLSHGDMLGSCVPCENRESAEFMMNAKASPNPSSSYFTIYINSTKPNSFLKIQVIDIAGRIVEERQFLQPGQNITLGHNYRPGVYFAEVILGDERRVLKLIKAN